MKGVISINALLGIVFLSAIIAAAGSPPFSLFVSEFYIITAAIKSGYIVSSLIFIFLLFFIFMGIMKTSLNWSMEKVGRKMATMSLHQR